MMKRGKSEGSALLNRGLRERVQEKSGMQNGRMLKYKVFARAFSYPDKGFFNFFVQEAARKNQIIADFDRLFRSSELWLYGAEYAAQNEFQRANILSDIMGFYRAFGLEPDKERPDSLHAEFEFMHYLIFKTKRAPAKEKAYLCLDAQRKFFLAHLYPAAKAIADKIIARQENNFYTDVVKDLLSFLEEEKMFLGAK